VKRAAGDVVGACLLQWNVPIDHLDDVDPRQQRLDEIAWNHGIGRPFSAQDSAGRNDNAITAPDASELGGVWIIGNPAAGERTICTAANRRLVGASTRQS
jgi:hypothetical protein